MGAPKISDAIASKSEASACLVAKSCKGSRAYDWFQRKLSVDRVAGNVGNQPIAGARIDQVPAIKLPVDPRLPQTALEQADRNALQPVRVYC